MTESNQGPATPGTAARAKELWDAARPALTNRRMSVDDLLRRLGHLRAARDRYERADGEPDALLGLLDEVDRVLWIDDDMKAGESNAGHGRQMRPPESTKRCERCGREAQDCGSFIAAFNGLHPPDGHDRDCYRFGFERLKAENASLLESLRESRDLLSRTCGPVALEDLRTQCRAAEKRCAELEKALRRAAGDLDTGAQWLEAHDRIAASSLKDEATTARAALHDEERRPRKHWPDCAMNHGGTDCDMGPDCGAPHPDRAAQGEEK